MSDPRLVGGPHSVKALLKAGGGRVERLWLQRGRRDSRLRVLRELALREGVEVTESRRDALDALAGGLAHQGVLARLREGEAIAPRDDPAAFLAARDPALPPPLVLVLDGVQDPHNLGACMRSADAAGADAVVVPIDGGAGLSATARKAAAGAAESMPVFQVVNLARTLGELARAGLWIHGAAGEAATSLHALDLAGPTALVMGAEGRGLRRLVRERCDTLFRIPMVGSVESLNVSVAAGVALFEARRQRDGGAGEAALERPSPPASRPSGR